MSQSRRGKKPKAREYSSESLLFRSVVGILLIALGVLSLISIFGGLQGSVFTMTKKILQGLGGSLCLGIPLFLLWGGGLIAFSALHRTPLRAFFLLLACYLFIVAIVDLLSGVGTQDLLTYVGAYNAKLSPPRLDPNGFLSMLQGCYELCSRNGVFGGALGMLLAWPLGRVASPVGGTVILSILTLACVLLFSKFDVVGTFKRLRERTDAALVERERKKQELANARALEEQQAKEEQERRKWQTPAYTRRQPQDAASFATAPQQPVAANPILYQPSPVPLYDEMIVPELPEGSKEPSWRLNQPTQPVAQAPYTVVSEPKRKHKASVTDNAPAAEAQPKDRATRKAIERMEEICKRKAEISQALVQEETKPADDDDFVLPPMTTESAPAPSAYQRPTASAQGEAATAYQKPVAIPPRVTAQTQIPMSGVQLDKPELKLPVKRQADDQPAKKPPTPYAYPTIELLNLKQQIRPDTRELDKQNAVKLEKTLESFNIPARVQRVTHGPAVTRFELGLISSGVNVKRILSITENIALDMAANGGVRLEIPIPGTTLFGIEVPNKEIIGVTLAEVLSSPEMTNAKSPLTVALGRDIAGQPVICDLAKMPHLLIAGQTGSGKSVCINAIINSLLYRTTPEQVRMIMIDPKVVELQCYNVVPHLLIPVVSDPHKASGALAWAVQEMGDRYKKMQSKGVREINAYNQKLEPGEPPLPRIVIVIDELNDLMMACKKDVEDSIIRLAQLARASGIHMVVATQRPTVDVITGLIKANIPSRIAFAVSSAVDSRTILDMNGAEKLLGKGDMFYFPTGSSSPTRVQGCFLSDTEIENVVTFIGKHSDTDFDPNVEEALVTEAEDVPSVSDSDADDGGLDDRLQEAIEMVLTDGQASISMLQRRMKIGYARAGRLIDDMAARGIVSKSAGSKPREILMSLEEFERLKETLLK